MVKDKNVNWQLNGWFMLVMLLAALVVEAYLGYTYGWTTDSVVVPANPFLFTPTPMTAHQLHFGPILLSGVGALFILFLMSGLVVIPPNQAMVFTFFGKYAGTCRINGFWWFNPLYSLQRVSLRRHNLDTPILKVNDRAGNPVEVSAVIVWQVMAPAEAVFNVQEYASYLDTQAESAVRQVIADFHYDTAPQTADAGEASGAEGGGHSLLQSIGHVATELKDEIQRQVEVAGIEIMQAQLSHLAYAPEIAQAMLRRQQATAIVAARKQIVQGAVGIVRETIEQIKKDENIAVQPSDQSRLIANLMVVLASDNSAQPVVSVGAAEA